MSDAEKIIQFLNFYGPALPTHVAKHINSNILLASAHLSELSSQGKVKLSNLKVGGSPLYYLSHHQEKLINFIDNFNHQDQEVIRTLKEKKILREKDLDLLPRVALRKAKDFAVPLNVSSSHGAELFWKWSLLSDTEAKELISDSLNYVLPPSEQTPLSSPQTSSPSLVENPSPLSQPEKEPETPTQEIFSESEKEKEKEKSEKQETLEEQRERKPLFKKIKERINPPKKRKEVIDTLTPQLEHYFQTKEILINSKETLRKNAEINFLVDVPSVIGKLTYFCKVKSKKRCDEKDLSAAYMEAQTKKIPLLFLYTNELTKKAQEMLGSGTFENAIVKKIE
jgi:hypothetical protein